MMAIQQKEITLTSLPPMPLLECYEIIFQLANEMIDDIANEWGQEVPYRYVQALDMFQEIVKATEQASK